MKDILKRTWADVYLDNVAFNFKSIRGKLHEGCKIMAVVKADAYGHGAVAISKLMEELNADYLGVSNFDEAMQLREAGISLPIIILGFTPPKFTARLIENNLTQTIFDEQDAVKFSQAAQKLDKRLKAHIKADTGMTRLGFLYEGANDPYQAADRIASVCRLEGLEIEGIFTHFAKADAKGDPYTPFQFERFLNLINELDKKGVQFKIKHCANSGAMINYPQTQLDMVRPGLILYGIYPSEDMRSDIDLKPAMSLRSVISQVKKISTGTPVSYGCNFKAADESSIAVISAGYADGIMRVLSRDGQMLVNGQRVKIAGTICMDMCMTDVTNAPGAKPGDMVTIFGSDGNVCLPVEEAALSAGTIPYELVCLVSKRVPRFYYRNGVECGHKNYIR